MSAKQESISLSNSARNMGMRYNLLFNICSRYSLAKRMPVKRVYTPALLLKMRREMEAGEELCGFEMERLVVTKVCKWNMMFMLVLCSLSSLG